MNREQRKKEAREVAALAVFSVIAVMAFAGFFCLLLRGLVMSEVIFIGVFFAIIICMGYLFERAGMKQDKRKGDE